MGRRSRAGIVLVLLAGVLQAGPANASAALGGPAPAGVGRWTTSGPGGGDIRAVAVDPTHPSTVYAGSWDYFERFGAGVYKSTDSGRHWSLSNRGLRSTSVYSLAVDPVTTTTVYVGTQSGGIFKSTDGGGHWAAIDSGVLETEVHAIAIDPADHQTLYIAAQYHSYPPSSSLYKSTDGGSSWSPIDNGLGGNTSVEALAIDPVDASTVYAGTDGGGVYKSIDGGASWQKASNDLDNTPYVVELALDPVAPDTLYATAYDRDLEYGPAVFKTTDGGASWSRMMNGFPSEAEPVALAIDPQADLTVYASAFDQNTYDPLGLYKTTDGGASWTLMGEGMFPSTAEAIVVDPVQTDVVYAGSEAGVYRTSDGGGLWRYASSGLLNASVDSLAMDPSQPDILYAGTAAGGVFKTSNAGLSWIPIHNGLLNGEGATDYRAIAIDPLDPSTVYAGSFRDGVFKSTDGGLSWTQRNAGLPNTEVWTLAVDPAIEGTAYAGVGGALYKTVDGAASWTAVRRVPCCPTVYAMIFDPTDPSIIYISVYDSNRPGVYKSTDGGEDWAFAGKGLGTLTPNSLAIDPSDPQTLYAGTSCSSPNIACIFRTTDGGRSWFPTGAQFMQSVTSLAIDPISTSTIYAGTEDTNNGGADGLGVMRSTDGGATWAPLNTGLRNLNVNCLVVDPRTGTSLHIGTTTSGVWDYSLG
jgi:photosystem II stability/assembly factor-like uncharacterized protein